MSLKDWFESKRNNTDKLDAQAVNARLSDEDLCQLWTQCFDCRENLPTKELCTNLMVCPKCGYHFRIGVTTRLEHLIHDSAGDSFEEMDKDLLPSDPLSFEDTQPYIERQHEARKKSQLNEAIVTGIAKMGTERFGLGMMDFGYLGGSMGSVVGEKITRLAERCLKERLPLVLFSASGGARMQEGTFSLMQMVKTGAVLAQLHEAGLLFISVLTEPTFGGVTASFGTLGDILIAEQGARIGFAGRRVIEQTIRQKLPPNFQTAEYLLDYGQLDRVLSRHKLRDELLLLLSLHRESTNNYQYGYADTKKPVMVVS